MLRGKEYQLHKFKYFLWLIWDCSHFGHQLEAHRLERLILGHNGYGSGICGVVTELKVHASWWSAHKVATILWQAQNFLLNLRFIGMSDPGGSTIASAALSLNECLLLLVERVENSLKNILQKISNKSEWISESFYSHYPWLFPWSCCQPCWWPMTGTSQSAWPVVLLLW